MSSTAVASDIQTTHFGRRFFFFFLGCGTAGSAYMYSFSVTEALGIVKLFVYTQVIIPHTTFHNSISFGHAHKTVYSHNSISFGHAYKTAHSHNARFTLADPMPRLGSDVVGGNSGRNHPTSRRHTIRVGWYEGVVQYCTTPWLVR